MLASPPFGILTERIQKELERARNDCERADGITLHRAQGATAALRLVLGLPAQILTEMKKSMDRRRAAEGE